MGVLSPTIHRTRARGDASSSAWHGRRVLYFRRHVVDEGATMCDEYYDARMKAFWRALAEEDERIPHEAQPPAPKNYIRPLHRDGPTRRPDAPGQSLRGSRKCGPDSSGLAGSVTVSRPNARGSSYARRDHSPRRSGACRRNTDRDTDRWAFRPASGARARFRISRAGPTSTAARPGSRVSQATKRA